jgi:hypothetical protein
VSPARQNRDRNRPSVTVNEAIDVANMVATMERERARMAADFASIVTPAALNGAHIGQHYEAARQRQERRHNGIR